jgi:hypothetical protein
MDRGRLDHVKLPPQPRPLIFYPMTILIYSEVFVATKAGQCVSVDQMISTQVGFIAQLKGTLTRKCYTAATILVDHYSRLKYVHLMTRLTSEETIEAKQAFEHFAEQHGVCILHYHCNNE